MASLHTFHNPDLFFCHPAKLAGPLVYPAVAGTDPTLGAVGS
jgi:hypothetical protein